MLSRLSEQKMHVIKLVLAAGWLVLILSLLYDPISPYLSDPSNLNSPLRIDPDKYLNPSLCVKVQGVCQPEIPYGIAARMFWAVIVPASLITIFVFGHEVWRRICPLSFFSQIPRALGIQRKQEITSATGKIRYQLFSVDKNSWLGKNYLYLQFGLFFLGLNIRILFVNSDRLALAAFFILTILAAIAVGYLFAGKSWCQYFCPMAPVEIVFTGTRGLLDSQSHLGQRLGVTQSMCREVDKSTGKEKSACVACQNPCIDIDSERAYWEQIERPDRKLLYYGYLGIVFGFFFYYFLYAGNWDYLYSGIWTHDQGQLAQIFSSGFYIFDQAIPIPKLIAAPLTLFAFASGTYVLGEIIERKYRQYLQKSGKKLTNDQILHQMFTVFTVIAWNVFWIFISRPAPLERFFTGFTVLVSGLWFSQTFWRTSEQYEREGLANKLRRQLEKLGIDMSRFVQRGTDELKPDEVYVLAKVLPEINRDQHEKLYRGVLIEALEDGSISSTEEKILKELRKELEIDIDQHYAMLANLGVEDPTLFNPDRLVTLEKRLRLDSYLKNLEFLIFDLVDSGVPIGEALAQKKDRIASLKQEYQISDEEDDLITAEILGESGSLATNAQQLIESLWDLHSKVINLEDLPTDPNNPLYRLLRSILIDREKIAINKLMSIIEVFGDGSTVSQIISSINLLTPIIFGQVLEQKRNERSWSDRFNQNVISMIEQATNNKVDAPIEKILPDDVTGTLISVLERLFYEDIEPLVQALSLEALSLIHPANARRAATETLQKGIDATSILAETAQAIAKILESPSESKPFTTLQKTLGLFETRFFHHININTLIEIARYCQQKNFVQGETICQAGDDSDELLIILDGQVDVIMKQDDGSLKVVNQCSRGETIGELGVLTQTSRSATVVVESAAASVLSLSDRDLDYLLNRNPLLSSTLLSIVSSRLQQILGQIK
jgi:CRP-like cAMP-binding protein